MTEGVSLLAPLAEVGTTIERLWRADGYDEHAFPALAARILTEAELHAKICYPEILEWVVGRHMMMPPKPSPGFGEPAVTLFHGKRFYLEALFWMDGTTTVHQHDFSGAFTVLAGSSIHSRFDFETTERVNDAFQLGELSWQMSELLERGAVRMITPGGELIHRLFHLGRPSVTIVARTRFDTSEHALIFDSPHVAYPAQHQTTLLPAQLQALHVLFATDRERALAVVSNLLATTDLETTYHLLLLCHRQALPGEDAEALLAVSRARFGERIAMFERGFTELARKTDLISRRGLVKVPEHRFLLALLLNVPARASVLEIIRKSRHDEEPEELLCRWVEELFRTPVEGRLGPTALGMPYDEAALFLLKGQLRGATLERLVADASEELGEDPEGAADTVRELFEGYRRSILRPLLV